MYKCCVCGKALTQPTAFVCAVCAGVHALTLSPEQWPPWARSELERERARRRFRPGFGVSGTDLNYEPYARVRDNQTYRRLNGVRKGPSRTPVRTGADNLFYSSGEAPEGAERVYEQLLGSLPGPLQQELGQGLDLRVILSDALASLPLISQRAMRAFAQGHDLVEIAEAEGVSVATMGWLIRSAQERLRDILEERLGADDGMRYRAR
ncbi:MAG: RNA polymerase sigma factor [Anaerolineae bacterium]